MKKTPKNLNQKGTSLIEVILYIALFSIIIIVIVDLLITSGSLKTESESQSGIQTDAALITSRLNYEIRNADTITIPTAIGQTTANLSLTTSSEIHTFSLSGNNLIYQKTVGLVTTSANLNTNLTNVSSLSFQALGSVGGKISIKINFTLTEGKATQQGNQTKNYEIIATSR